MRKILVRGRRGGGDHGAARGNNAADTGGHDNALGKGDSYFAESRHTQKKPADSE